MLKCYAYSLKNRTQIIHLLGSHTQRYTLTYWWPRIQSPCACLDIAIWNMALSAGKLQVWNGFTDCFTTIQLENPRFMEDKSNLTGLYQYHVTYILWHSFSTWITSFCCQQKAAFCTSFLPSSTLPSTRHLSDMNAWCSLLSFKLFYTILMILHNPLKCGTSIWTLLCR